MAATNIKGIKIVLEADASKLDKQLRAVDKEARKTDTELRAINRALKFNPKNVDLWRQKQTVLNNKIKDTGNKLKLLKQQQKNMDSRGVDKNSAEYRKLQREIIETESKLKHFNQELKKTGNARLTALGNQMKDVGQKMQAAGRTMSMYVTAPLVAAGTISAKKFAEVDKTMQLTNSTMNNTAAEADLLNKAMKSAASASTFGMNDAATATLNFARAGLKAEEAAEALAPAMALAAGEGGELDTVSAGLVATINGFHDEFTNAGKYADVFANACNNSALDVNSLSTAMSIAAPIFSSAGYSVEDAALYMGVMANNGIEANKAANSLKTGLARLVSPAKDGAKMMEQLGISVTNSDGTMKDSVQIQQELHDAFGQLSESEQIAAASAIFGKNQMAPWLALINTAPGDVGKLNDALGQSGTAMQMQADMMSGFGGSIEQLKSGLDVLATSLGEALAPMIQKVVGWIQKLTDWFNGLSPQAQQIIAVVGVVVAAIGPLLLVVGTLVTLIGNLIIFGPVILAALGGVAAAIGPVVLAIGAAIAAGVLLYKNWDKIKAKAIAIKNAVVAAWNNMKTQIVNAFNAARTAVSNTVNSIRQKVVGAFNDMKASVASVWNGVKNTISEKINAAKDTISGFVNKIKGMFSGIKITFPHVPIPHFSIQPPGWKLGDLVKGKIPSLKVETFAKAMQSGRILRGATIFGEQDGKLLQGGEAGAEVVAGANTVSGLIAAAVARGMSAGASEMAAAIQTAVRLSGSGGMTIEVPVYLYKNGPQMGREIVTVYDTWKKRLG